MNNLAKAIAPSSIAVLGASDNPHKVGGRPIAFMRQYGYAGRIYPVNPHRQEIQDLRAYPSLVDLPEVPDLAVVAVGGQEGVELVRQCANAGVAAVVVMASGYAESGVEGRNLQEQMVLACRAKGTRLIGPNCQGLSNFQNGAIANFSTIFHEQPGRDGPLAIIGQSGATTQSIYVLAQARGIHARYVHATGNEADVTTAELLEQTVEDADIRAIVMYVETIADPQVLARAAIRAAHRGVPVIAIKGGRTASGQRAATSHTGAMATEDRMIDAFFERHHIIRAVDPFEAISIAALCIEAPLPRGCKLVAMSNSGASCVMSADMADEFGIPLLQFDELTGAQLRKVLPSYSQASNPIDLTGALLTDRQLFPGVIDTLIGVTELDILLVSFPIAGSGYDVEGYADALARLASKRPVTIVVAAYQEPIRKLFQDHGILTYNREREALQALGAYAAYAMRRHNIRPEDVDNGTEVPTLPKDGAGVLDEARSLNLLRSIGVATVPFELCVGPEAAVEVAGQMGGPVVIKGCSPDILHKSEHGLVALNLATAEQVRDAALRIESTLGMLKVRNRGLLVAGMLSGGRELALGAHVDPKFGPVILIGDGGIYLEALKDLRFLIPPFGEAEVLEALAHLRIAPLLAGVRGEPAVDVQAFARMAVRLGKAVARWGTAIRSIDINPVKLLPAGQGAFALDAVVELAEPAA